MHPSSSSVEDFAHKLCSVCMRVRRKKSREFWRKNLYHQTRSWIGKEQQSAKRNVTCI